jgi:hypothetical protein
MGTRLLDVSTDDLGALAQDLRACAGEVRKQSAAMDGHLFGLGSGGPWGTDSEAGRAHWQSGQAVHDGLQRIADWLRHWSGAVDATADALGTTSVGYAWTDGERAGQISAIAD